MNPRISSESGNIRNTVGTVGRTGTLRTVGTPETSGIMKTIGTVGRQATMRNREYCIMYDTYKNLLTWYISGHLH